MSCLVCDRDVAIRARGLCSGCYEVRRINGGLSAFPDSRYKEGKVEVACKCCGMVFVAYRNTTSGERKYCSHKCYTLSKRIFTEQQEQRILALYRDGRSSISIGKLFSASHTAILDVLKRNNEVVRKNTSYRKYTLNEQAFDVLDKSAVYWLGFVHSDGFVRTDGLYVALKESDVLHLEKLKLFLGSNAPIKHRVSEMGNTNRVAFHSYYLASRLIELGIISRRGAFSCLVKEVSEKMYPDLLRGLVDGDGFITKQDTDFAPSVGFVGRHDAVTWVRNTILKYILPDSSASIRCVGRNSFEIAFGGLRQVQKVLVWMYDNSVLHLDRKKVLADFWSGQ